MEQLVFSALIFQSLTGLAVLAAAAAEALRPRRRPMHYWKVQPVPVVVPASVYDLQEAAEEESYPRAA